MPNSKVIQIDGREFVTLDVAAVELEFSVFWLRRLIKHGKISAEKYGQAYLVNISDLRKYFAKHAIKRNKRVVDAIEDDEDYNV